MSEETEKKNKKRQRNTYLLHWARPTYLGPARPSRHPGCHLPQAARQLRARHATAATPPTCLAPPQPPEPSRHVLETHTSIPLPPEPPPPPLSPVPPTPVKITGVPTMELAATVP